MRRRGLAKRRVCARCVIDIAQFDSPCNWEGRSDFNVTGFSHRLKRFLARVYTRKTWSETDTMETRRTTTAGRRFPAARGRQPAARRRGRGWSGCGVTDGEWDQTRDVTVDQITVCFCFLFCTSTIVFAWYCIYCKPGSAILEYAPRSTYYSVFFSFILVPCCEST